MYLTQKTALRRFFVMTLDAIEHLIRVLKLGNVLLSRALRQSTIAATGLHVRVRNENGF